VLSGYETPDGSEGDQRMKLAGETQEDRIRECAYYLWESSGRPVGRDHEFWQRASEMIAGAKEPQAAKPQRRRTKQSPSSEPARKRSRKSQSAASETTAPPG
jgi:hypothetical protein